MRFFALFISLISGLLSFETQADPLLIQELDKDKLLSIGSSVAFLEDAEGVLTLDQVLSEKYQQQFVIEGKPLFNRPPSPTVYWYKFEIDNQSSKELWLILGNAFLSWEYRFFKPTTTGEYQQVPELGLLHPQEHRELDVEHYVTNLYDKGEVGKRIFYLRSDSRGMEAHNFSIGQKEAVFRHGRSFDRSALLFIGLLAGLIIFNLIIWDTQNMGSIYFILFLLNGSFSAPIVGGYLIFDYTWFGTHLLFWQPSLLLFQVLFIRHFFELPKTMPKTGKVLLSLAFVACVGLPILRIADIVHLSYLRGGYQMLLLLINFICFGIGVSAIRRELPGGGVYLSAWCFYFIGTFYFLLFTNGFIQGGWLSGVNVLYISVGLQSILFTIAFRKKIHSEKQTLLAENKRVQQENIRILSEQKEQLDKMVEERTTELVYANEELQASEEEIRQHSEEILAINERLKGEMQRTEDAMNALRKTKNQLVQAEKMSSLGQLTAGVAHEINNPVNFIAAGTQTLQSIINDTFKLMERYMPLSKDLDDAQRKEALQKLEELQQEFGTEEELKEDAQSLMQDITQGTDRVTEIIKGLRNFSRSDSALLVFAEVHEILDSTLIILQSKYKNRIEIKKDYTPNSLNIQCYAGQLSQVFVNIISNAIDAIPEKGMITLCTQDLGEQVEIVIKDTGKGIPMEIINDIFNPFFTTKDVGKGTGLGLSISYGIIEKHQGTIKVESELDAGTTFHIILLKEIKSNDTPS